MRIVLSCLALISGLLTGCAATVTSSSTQSPSVAASAELPRPVVPVQSLKVIVLNLSGTDAATGSADWQSLKAEWEKAMRSSAGAAGAAFSIQEGEPRAAAEAGTLVAVHVNRFRFVAPVARIMFGIMTGSAYIDARVQVLDLRSGAPVIEQTYNATSKAGQGIFSAVTDKQVQAIADEIVREIGRR